MIGEEVFLVVASTPVKPGREEQMRGGRRVEEGTKRTTIVGRVLRLDPTEQPSRGVGVGVGALLESWVPQDFYYLC